MCSQNEQKTSSIYSKRAKEASKFTYSKIHAANRVFPSLDLNPLYIQARKNIVHDHLASFISTLIHQEVLAKMDHFW